MNYDAVLFDAAETLFTTRGSVGEIYSDIARHYGSHATSAEIDEAFRRHFKLSGPLSPNAEKQWWKDVVFHVFLDVGMIPDFDRFFDEVYEAFRDSRGWRLFPETKDVLTRLHAHRLKLAVVSNFDSRLYSVLEDLQIRQLFDAITICSEVGYAKPHPAIFQAALSALEVQPSRALFTGDSLVDDFHGGEAVGMKALLLDRSARYSSMSSSVPGIRNLRELLPYVGVPSDS